MFNLMLNSIETYPTLQRNINHIISMEYFLHTGETKVIYITGTNL